MFPDFTQHATMGWLRGPKELCLWPFFVGVIDGAEDRKTSASAGHGDVGSVIKKPGFRLFGLEERRSTAVRL